MTKAKNRAPVVKAPKPAAAKPGVVKPKAATKPGLAKPFTKGKENIQSRFEHGTKRARSPESSDAEPGARRKRKEPARSVAKLVPDISNSLERNLCLQDMQPAGSGTFSSTHSQWVPQTHSRALRQLNLSGPTKLAKPQHSIVWLRHRWLLFWTGFQRSQA